MTGIFLDFSQKLANIPVPLYNKEDICKGVNLMREPVRQEIKPGVFLTCIQTTQLSKSNWSIRFLLPLNRDTAAMNALLPYVLRCGTASCPSQEQLDRALWELGGTVTPVVSKKGEVHCIGFTAYFDENGQGADWSALDRAAHMLGDLILRPATKNGRLRADDVNSEKAALLERIQSGTEEILDLLIQEMCAGEAYGIHPFGSVETLSKINVTRLNQHYKKILSTARVEAYYHGSAPVKRVEQAWREALMELPRRNGEQELVTDWGITPDEPRTFSTALDSERAGLVLGFRTGCGLNSLRYPALVVTKLLFENALKRLPQLHTTLDAHKGLLFTQCDVDAETDILACLDMLRSGDFTDEALTTAKQTASDQFRSILEEPEALAEYWLDQTLTEFRIPPEGLADVLTLITRDEVIQSAQALTLDSIARFESASV